MRKILIAILLCWSASLYAAEDKKEYNASFSKDGVEEVVIVNSYGDVEISQAADSLCTVSAVVTVEAKSPEKVAEVLASVSITESVSGASRTFATGFGKDLGVKKAFAGVKVNSAYSIQVPRGMKVRVVNSAGNVIVGNFEGQLNADIDNGDFHAGTLRGKDFYIKQSGGTCEIAAVDVLDGEWRNCHVLIGDGDDIRLDLSSCDGDIASAGKLNVRSSGGKMQIGDVERLLGSSSFTKYEVQDLADLLDMDMKMGELNIRNIRPLFSEIRLKSSFTKVGLSFMDKASYVLEIKRNKSLKLDLPEGLVLEDAPASERNVRIGIATVGNPEQAGKVTLELSNGSFFLQ